MHFFALYIDITGIQRFVFGSNKLKENFGASYLLEKIFSEDEIASQKGVDKSLSIIGGGNALLAFSSKIEAEGYLKEFTAKLLCYAPGVGVSAVIEQIDTDSNVGIPFKEQMNMLFKHLQKKKSSFVPVTVISKHGFTATCARSGYSCEVYNYNGGNEPGKGAYISAAANAKLEAAEEAYKTTKNSIKDILMDDFLFAEELDKLSQSKNEDSHIAIVHIDGNAMGERFSKCPSFEEYKKLSESVRKRFTDAFRALVNKYIDNVKSIENDFGLYKTDGKIILPIRPIIIGGDDITFVTYGKLGIESSKLFMEELIKEKVSDGETVTACAGVAIIKEKYPFFRGYQLAEALCSSAKAKRLNEKSTGCWLDFHIAFSGISGTIDEVRELQYKLGVKKMLYRPYTLEDENIYSYKKFTEGCNVIAKWPHSKQKEFRQVLSGSKSDIEAFKAHLNVRGYKLPFAEELITNEIFNNNWETPYFDMVESAEFLEKIERN